LTAPAARMPTQIQVSRGGRAEEADGEEQGERRVARQVVVAVQTGRSGSGSVDRGSAPNLSQAQNRRAVIPPAFPSEDEDAPASPRPLAGAPLCSEVSRR